MSTNKLLCTECHWHGTVAQMLTAPNPFLPDDEIHGCPTCRAVGTLVYACEHPDCWQQVSCGTPVGDDYRQTCGKHLPLSVEGAEHG